MNKQITSTIGVENQILNHRASFIVLVLTAFIPVVYTLVSNLPKQTATPVISPVATVITQPVNQFAEIETALQKANTAPGYDTYINLGMAYYNTGKYEESIKAWEKALEYNNNGDLAYNNIAAAYGNLQNYDAEIEVCKKALSINPHFELAKRNLQWATEMKNKKAK